MRKLSLILLLLVVGGFTVPAHANIDPRILMDDPACSVEDPTQIGYSGGTAAFSANASGGGFFLYCNNTGTTLSSIDVKFVNTPNYTAADIVCTSTSGFACQTTINDGIVDLLFTPFSEIEIDSEVVGYLPGSVLSFNLNGVEGTPPRDPNGTGGWEPGLTFFWAGNESAQIVPEPASVLLFGSGLAALFGLRRRRM